MSSQSSLPQKLKGKTAIITAGNRGGGASLALRFASAGANVAIIAPKETTTNLRLNEISDQIKASGGKAKTWEVDLTSFYEIESAATEIFSFFGSIDIVVNNFSTFNFKPALETSSEEFNKVIGNVFTTFFLSQVCIPYLKDSPNPHVINIAPPLDMVSAQAACEHHLLFSISKYGMSFCTMGLAKECKNLGIAFNSLWQERPVSTATLSDNFSNDVVRGSNRPEIYAEAAYLISLKPAKEFSGNYCIDEALLIESGIDVSKYAVDPAARPVKDIFLPGADYSILKTILRPKS